MSSAHILDEAKFEVSSHTSDYNELVATESSELADSVEAVNFIESSLLTTEPNDLFHDAADNAFGQEQQPHLTEELNFFQLTNTENSTEWVLPDALNDDETHYVIHSASANESPEEGQVFQVMSVENASTIRIIGDVAQISSAAAASGIDSNSGESSTSSSMTVAKVTTSQSRNPAGRPPKNHVFVYICDKCSRQFDTENKLKIHLRYHEPNVRRVHCCVTGCPWSFQNEANLQRHIELHKRTEKPFQCTESGCEQRFTTEHNLQQHLKIHQRPKFSCEAKNCHETFSTLKLYHAHVAQHQNEIEAPFICEQCGMKFFRSSSYGSHMRSHKSSYTCEECGRVFTRASEYRNHRRVHTGERPFACRLCQWSFTTSSKLTRHMRKHTQQREFKCDHEGCGKAFLRPEHLRDHALLHTGGKPFQCPMPECKASFAARSSLFVHVRKHKLGELDDAGGIPRSKLVGRFVFPCPTAGCKREFRAANVLKNHLKSEHALDLDKRLLNGAKKVVNEDGESTDFVVSVASTTPRFPRKTPGRPKQRKIKLQPTTSTTAPSVIDTLNDNTERLLFNELAWMESEIEVGDLEVTSVAEQIDIEEAKEQQQQQDMTSASSLSAATINLSPADGEALVPQGYSARTVPIIALMAAERRRPLVVRRGGDNNKKTSSSSFVALSASSHHSTTAHYDQWSSSTIPHRTIDHSATCITNNNSEDHDRRTHDITHWMTSGGSNATTKSSAGVATVVSSTIKRLQEQDTAMANLAAIDAWMGQAKDSGHGAADGIAKSEVVVPLDDELAQVVQQVASEDLLMSDALITPHCSDVILTSSVTNDMLDNLYL